MSDFDFDSIVGTAPSTCPNEVRPNSRLAIVGEAPGLDETREGKPFCGTSGKLLWALLGQRGIVRSECSVLNVSQLRPSGNDFNLLQWEGASVQDGITALIAGIETAQPNLVLVLGNAALHVALRGNEEPPKRAGKYAWPRHITDWRGSVFWSPVFKRKCLAALHPAAVLRQYEWIQLLRFDVLKASREVASPQHTPKARVYHCQPTLPDVLARLHDLAKRKPLLSVDIEGGIATLKCISFATSDTDAFVVPFTNADGTSYWRDAAEEAEVWYAMSKVLCEPTIPKVLQNALYDCFVMPRSYRCPIRGVVDDTMLKHWELLPELEKSLAVQASIYTDQPYYKEGRQTEGLKLWEYCCTDSAITYEINQVLSTQLKDPDSLLHYRRNVALLAPLLYAQIRGIAFSTQRRDEIIAATQREAYGLRLKINIALGQSLSQLDASAQAYMCQLAHEKCCYKRADVQRGSDIVANAKSDFVATAPRIAELVDRAPNLTALEWGELETLLDVGVNVDSPKQMSELLYQKLALPIVYKKEKGRLTDRVTTDALALLTIYRKTKNEVVKSLLKLRNKQDAVQGLQIGVASDGRVRCSYNLVGTETGRLACYESVEGTGTNLQTITKKHRRCFTADEGYEMGQLDLSGADSWTVAAWSAALGDRTMLDDLLYGLKPAKLIALAYTEGNSVMRQQRDWLKVASKRVDSEAWQYFASKVVLHGDNYMMGANTTSDNILKNSYKFTGDPIYVEPKVCEELAAAKNLRYSGVKAWHRHCESLLRASGKLKSASGSTRIFFGRRDDVGTLKEWLAHEPQANTTYATNMALLRLWTDPSNRRADARLIVEPLHQVHDALLVQWHTDTHDFALSKLRTWFNNPLTIAGITVTIPFEGTWGWDWGMHRQDCAYYAGEACSCDLKERGI